MKTQAELMRELINQLNENTPAPSQWSDDDYYERSGADRLTMHDHTNRVDGQPDYNEMVAASNFDLTSRQLISLYGSPDVVNGDFRCNGNPDLSTLQFGPKEVGGSFSCNDTAITSLQYSPRKVGGNFFFPQAQVTSLEGAPEEVGNMFICENAQLSSYAGMPKKARLLAVKAINPNSLGELHKYVQEAYRIRFHYDTIQGGILGLFNIKNLCILSLSPSSQDNFEETEQLEAIINEFLPMGKKGMMKCQLALIKAGFKDLAKL